MFELYLRCPATDEPVYAGFLSETSLAPVRFDGMSVCPACGAKHDWSAAAVWSAIPMMVSPEEAPAVETVPVAPPLEGRC